jgi:hypothetical protein
MTVFMRQQDYDELLRWCAQKLLPKEFQRSLMSDGTSRHNKLWLLTGWKAVGYWFEWKWQGEPGRSRMMFSFEPGQPFKAARSFEEDVLPMLKWTDQ